MKKIESEFGKGVCYCLGMFLAHADRYSLDKISYDKSGLNVDTLAMTWFNGAGDHLYELEFGNNNFTPKIRRKLRNIKEKSLKWRLSMGEDAATGKDVEWAISEAKEILRLIDEFMGIKTIKAGWS